MNKSLTLKRLHYRSCHRGNKESDIVLSHFAERSLASLNEAELAVYEQFLEEDDAYIWDWLLEKTPAPPQYNDLLIRLRNQTINA